MNETSTRPYRLKPRSGLAVQYAAIRALFLRELQTRFGHYRLGYLWAILEPGLQVVFFLIIFGAVMKRVIPGMDYSLFLINGMLPFFMFMRSATRALSVVESNRGLFSYRSVKPIDALIARTALEAALYFGVYLLFSGILLWLGKDISFSNLPFLLLCWLLLFIFSIGFSLIMMVIGDLSEEIGKFIGAIFFVFYLMSGIIYSVHIIPVEYQGYILWNPIVHCIESMRHAVAPGYPVNHVSMIYFFECLIGILFFGLLLYRGFEKRMLKTK
ncbi:ABC transporter permease [Alkanindiges sp. WGS2144]|uniref:ABC transporter permease n=1 Tax=Alkanindiges sp. WGS2144 TaxID=3366808 RepID=UPI003752EAF0